ncbi:unnamed protein product [Penicillium camemberti]|uniref:Str. FM013 n=1 Tax=Penicillium camemberti (strain FM 013) TaxID=1429867 RepID=A0A0G4P029_PENC3|nr:unnamed protein product [Penicillium camemberti]
MTSKNYSLIDCVVPAERLRDAMVDARSRRSVIRKEIRSRF